MIFLRNTVRAHLSKTFSFKLVISVLNYPPLLEITDFFIF